ncbi:MAG: C1 family peptidase [Candidatus Desulfacyla sp.]
MGIGTLGQRQKSLLTRKAASIVRHFMKARGANRILGICIGVMLIIALVPFAEADQTRYTNTIMHPDRETRLEWMTAFEMAPLARIDERLSLNMPLRGSLSLLNHLSYIPAERDQGACGNCWAWAGTGIMEISLSVEENVFDRLSVQFISSCNRGKRCCEGGWTRDVASFYSLQGFAIPWPNTNAYWQDGDGTCDVPCTTIATSPNYSIVSITSEAILTHGVGQAQAIANIKNILNQNRAVFFGFFMGAPEDWNRFYSFWNTQSETALWNFDSSCNKPYTSSGGGHAVLCVGYNDDDPNNSYWIMVNSWGTTPERPNGIFRVDMDMDYDCYYTEGFQAFYSLYWQTLDITFDIAEEIVYVEPSASCGGHTPCYSTIQEAINICDAKATIKIAEGRYPEDVTLNSAKNITLEGGWDASFSMQPSFTTVNSLTVNGGTITTEYLICQ